MSPGHAAGLVGGVVVVAVVLWDVVETIVSPRRVSRRFRLTRGVYRMTWIPWRAVGRRIPSGKRRESFLSVFGPTSVLLLLVLWVAMVVTGFTLLQWGAGSGVQRAAGRSEWLADLILSGMTLFTLTGDLAPLTVPARVLTILEAGTGLGLLAIVIGYLPTLSQAFSRREVSVSSLDARAGSPPSAGELLLRHAGDARQGELATLFGQWEAWSADLMETHVSFPALAYYRSQHVNQSWVAALTTILDACALVLAVVDEPQAARAARLTFAIARHAAVDLCLVFRLRPKPPADRLPDSALAPLWRSLRGAGLALTDTPETEAKLKRLRAMYEPQMNALSLFLAMPLPEWRGDQHARDNWCSLV
jgi:hypothetical protein